MLFNSVQADTTTNEATKNNVVVFQSYHQQLPWTCYVQEGIQDSLESANIELFVEYMDSYRLNSIGIEESMFYNYQEKYGNMDISCIVIVDNYAFDFISQYYDELFNGVPIVFAGINNLSEEKLFTNNMTGMGETSYQIEYIQLIQQLNQDVTSIVMVGSNSVTAIESSEAFVEAGSDFAKEISITAELDDTLEGLVDALSSYDEKTVLVVTGTIKDNSGKFIDHQEFARTLREKTGLSVYGSATVYVGDEAAIGAYGPDPYRHGEMAGEAVKRILAGEAAENIPIEYMPVGQYIFDYNLLEQYNIDIKDLPKESIILNSPDELIVINEDEILLYVVILVFLIITIIILVLNTKKRKKVERQLVDSQKEVEEKNERLKKSYIKLSQKQQKLSEQYVELCNKNKEIKFLLYYDAITKLYKRDRLIYEIDNLIKINKDGQMVVYAMNIGNIKTLDDTYGHVIGDMTRTKVGEMVKDILPDHRYLHGRHHDNYFIVDHDSDAFNSINNTIIVLKDTIEKTIYIKGIEIELKIKVGIIKYELGSTGDDLIKKADIAVVEAINQSNKIAVTYKEEYLAKITQRMVVERDIKKALLRDEFELYFQPQIDAYSEKVKGCEALIRWNRDDGSITYPGSFIGIAEETGLIDQIGRWVIDRSCQHLQEWETKGIDCSVSVNVSAKQVDSTLVYTLKTALEKYGIKPEKLIVELTETAFMDVIEHRTKVLNEINDLGIILSLDDFGTGYSSLNYIKEFPIKKLKIDKSFIDNIHEQRQQAITKAIVMLGKELGNDIIAEGVEKIEQLEILKMIGVSEIQGWYYSKAIKEDAFVQYYREKNN
jgi:predicted signal transduction protein with EAL and GGDEF domain/ABC-type uncharacterized transport system substrate-binding protein